MQTNPSSPTRKKPDASHQTFFNDGNITVDNLDFVYRMPNLRSIWLPNAVLHHTPAERELLRSTGIQGLFDQE